MFFSTSIKQTSGCFHVSKCYRNVMKIFHHTHHTEFQSNLITFTFHSIMISSLWHTKHSELTLRVPTANIIAPLTLPTQLTRSTGPYNSRLLSTIVHTVHVTWLHLTTKIFGCSVGMILFLSTVFVKENRVIPWTPSISIATCLKIENKLQY